MEKWKGGEEADICGVPAVRRFVLLPSWTSCSLQHWELEGGGLEVEVLLFTVRPRPPDRALV